MGTIQNNERAKNTYDSTLKNTQNIYEVFIYEEKKKGLRPNKTIFKIPQKWFIFMMVFIALIACCAFIPILFHDNDNDSAIKSTKARIQERQENVGRLYVNIKDELSKFPDAPISLQEFCESLHDINYRRYIRGASSELCQSVIF